VGIAGISAVFREHGYQARTIDGGYEELSPEQVMPAVEETERELVHAWPGKGEEKLPQATGKRWPYYTRGNRGA
jgi:hypothetical protein